MSDLREQLKAKYGIDIRPFIPCPLCDHEALTRIGAQAHWTVDHGFARRVWYRIKTWFN